MNFQPLIDQLPAVLVALGFLLWAASRLLDSVAKRNPAIDEWDKRAETLKWVSARYAQALEWLVQAGVEKWSGAQKLEELNRRVKEFEADWQAGNYLEALSKLSGFYQSAMSKLEAAQRTTLPFVTRQSLLTNPPSQPVSAEIGPDDPAVEENTDGKSGGPGRGEGGTTNEA